MSPKSLRSKVGSLTAAGRPEQSRRRYPRRSILQPHYWTVSVTDPVVPFAVAVIVVVPTVTLAAIPEAVPMFATVVFEELQVAVTV